MDSTDWVARAKPVDAALIEVGFLVSDSFYFGPKNGFTSEQWQSLREPLYQPALVRHQGWVLTSPMTEFPAELLTHNVDVIRLRDKHGEQWERQPSYFWMRSLIFLPEIFEISFSWYDTWDEAMFLLDALESPGDGETFRFGTGLGGYDRRVRRSAVHPPRRFRLR